MTDRGPDINRYQQQPYGKLGRGVQIVEILLPLQGIAAPKHLFSLAVLQDTHVSYKAQGRRREHPQ